MTFHSTYDIIYTEQRGGAPHKPERITNMKTERRTTQLTTKEIRISNDAIVHLPYGDDTFETLQGFDGITGYNSGCYGWNYDVIECAAFDNDTDLFKHLAICCGYRSMPKATHRLTDDTIAKISHCKHLYMKGDYLKANKEYKELVIRIEEI